MKATQPFTVNGKNYPAGSLVVQSAQAFRPHVMDMFEPQNHPNDFQYPGGPPIPPYDSAGWTLALQMGVQFDRELDGFTGPFEKVNGLLDPPPATVSSASHPAGYLIDHRVNDSFIVVNRLMKAGCAVYWLAKPPPLKGRDFGSGAIWLPACSAAQPILENAAQHLGVAAYALAKTPTGTALKLKPIRVGFV